MYSITEFLGGTSNIAVEHPETCSITYNLEAKFYFKSFISEEVRTAESSSSLSLSEGSQIVQDKVVSM